MMKYPNHKEFQKSPNKRMQTDLVFSYAADARRYRPKLPLEIRPLLMTNGLSFD